MSIEHILHYTLSSLDTCIPTETRCDTNSQTIQLVKNPRQEYRGNNGRRCDQATRDPPLQPIQFHPCSCRLTLSVTVASTRTAAYSECAYDTARQLFGRLPFFFVGVTAQQESKIESPSALWGRDRLSLLNKYTHNRRYCYSLHSPGCAHSTICMWRCPCSARGVKSSAVAA